MDPASDEFIENYQHNTCITIVINYFDQEYVLKRTFWYRGAAPGFLLNNNGQEGKHNGLKKKGLRRFFRKRTEQKTSKNFSKIINKL